MCNAEETDDSIPQITISIQFVVIIPNLVVKNTIIKSIHTFLCLTIKNMITEFVSEFCPSGCYKTTVTTKNPNEKHGKDFCKHQKK
jgi:hypothetical protein